MTVTTTATKIIYQGNAGTTVWSFSFPGVAIGDIQVYYTDTLGNQTLLSPGSYSVALNAAIAPNPTGIGGTVTYPLSGSPIAVGTLLTIVRNLPQQQNTSLANQGTLFQSAIEAALDYLMMSLQQLQEMLGRQFTVPISDPNPAALPTASQRANSAAIFDSSGNLTSGLVPSGGVISSAMAPVCAASSIAVAQGLLGIASIPVGIEADWPGLVAPTGWFIEDGSTVSRTTYAALMAAIAPTFAATLTNGSNQITGISSTANWNTGWAIEGTGISPGATITAILSSSSVQISSNVGASPGSSVQIFPYGNGDGSTTFTIPDGRGYTYAGLDAPNGAGTAGRITVAGGNFDGTKLAKTGGLQNHILVTGEIPAHNHTINITDPGHVHAIHTGSRVSADGGGANYNDVVSGSNNSDSATTGITATAANTGGGTAHTILQPTSIRNKIIYHG